MSVKNKAKPIDAILGEELNRTDSFLLSSKNEGLEIQVRRMAAKSQRLEAPSDLCWHVLGGQGRLIRDGSRHSLEIKSESLCFIPQGWRGEMQIDATLDLIETQGPQLDGAKAIMQAQAFADVTKLDPEDFADWGAVPTMITGRSQTAGLILHRRASGNNEIGLWRCTPGTWDCHVTAHEYCYFFAGQCIYRDQAGNVLEIREPTLALFPKDWKGTCEVIETVTKSFLIA